MINNCKCCKNCVPPKRQPGCHGHCEEYLSEKKELDKIREKLAREQRYKDDYYRSSEKRIEYFKKQKKKRIKTKYDY